MTFATSNPSARYAGIFSELPPAPRTSQPYLVISTIILVRYVICALGLPKILTFIHSRASKACCGDRASRWRRRMWQCHRQQRFSPARRPAEHVGLTIKNLAFLFIANVIISPGITTAITLSALAVLIVCKSFPTIVGRMQRQSVGKSSLKA
jgi:hypothetical protein